MGFAFFFFFLAIGVLFLHGFCIFLTVWAFVSIWILHLTFCFTFFGSFFFDFSNFNRYFLIIIVYFFS